VSIINRQGKWGVKVWDPGTRRYRWVGTFPTRAEAEMAEADQTTRRGDTPTVNRWARVWLSDYAREAPATQRTYRYAVAAITRDLGHLKLTDVDRPHGRRLAKGWPRGTTRVARTMWADAVRDGVCEINPFSNLRLETPKGRRDIDALTEPEIVALANTAAHVHRDYGPEARAIILTLGYVGVRPGELCALRRADLNAPDREITVRLSLDGTGREKAPKNGKARIITVPPPALHAIQPVPKVLGSPYLFHSQRGARLSKGTLNYMWRPVLSAWIAGGGRDLDLYELRHAAATLLLERGLTPADVAVQLGHSDGGRLCQVLYGHPSEDLARDRLKMAFAGSERAQVGARSGRMRA